jgi:uncharacterized RDD family membrane protein YckC
MSVEERQAHIWEVAKQLKPSVAITNEQFREFGLQDWMEAENSIARMQLIFFCCTAIICTVWVASGLVAYFTTDNTGMFLASPLIALPVYKTIEYFAKRIKQARR